MSSIQGVAHYDFGSESSCDVTNLGTEPVRLGNEPETEQLDLCQCHAGFAWIYPRFMAL